MRMLSKMLMLVLAVAAVPMAFAGPDRPPHDQDGRFFVAQQDGLTLNEAVERVRRKYQNSRILSAETRRNGNREVHIIKVLTEDGK
ncbi:MAG TPA: hypothetical protein VFG91_10105, partial [Woeseiaceae bacterium]|nr:hypothetical protein [Woeseiaceae bacterium]